MFRFTGRLPVVFAVIFTTFLLYCSAVAQNTVHVPGDQATIQGAINIANNGDTVLVAPGTYVENINFNGKAITLISSAGAAQTIIDGGRNGSVATFNNRETSGAVLNGFTIQNGAAIFYPYFDGGGIYIGYSASPTIVNNIIQNNGACSGGGIGSNNGSARIQGNIIQNNFQLGCIGGDGGGISLGAANSAQIIGNVIKNNDVSKGGDGGGISLNGGVGITIANNIISGNITGGVSPASGGGGIYMINGPDVLIEQNLIYNNTAGWGSGVYFSVNDTARGPWLVGNTILGDPAASQGSVVYGSYFDAQVEFFNNLLIGFAGQIAVECAGPSPSFSNNDAYSPNGSGLDGSCAGQSGQNGNISSDPQFVNAAAGDFHLQSTSPAIDAGTNSAPNLPQTDFAGNPRIFDGNNDCVSTTDLGVYELQGTANVSFSANSLTFPSQPIGSSSSPRPVTLSNTGSTCFQFSNIGISRDFSQSNTCSAAGVRGGTSCVFNVTFTPTVFGTRLGALTATGSDGITTMSPSVNLSGVGADFSIAASPASASVKHGQSVKFTVTVNPLGGSFTSAVALSCAGLPSGASCTFSPSSLTPGERGATSVMTVSTVGKTPRGNYNVLIVGKSGSDSHSTTVLLSVN
jgi:hypothetical protein